MSLSRDEVQVRKWKTIRRAQYRLRQALERIDWEESELLPEIEQLKAGKAVMGLLDESAINIEVKRENPTDDDPNQHAAADADQQPLAAADDHHDS